MTDRDVKLTPPPTHPAQRVAWDAYYEPRNAAFRRAKPEGKTRPLEIQPLPTRLPRLPEGGDESVERLLKFLDAEGLADNTLLSMPLTRDSILGNTGGSTSGGFSRNRCAHRCWRVGRPDQPGRIDAISSRCSIRRDVP